MEPIGKLQKHMTLEHKVVIKTSPDRIWDFLLNIEENYTTWHPKDHILFRWTKGAPFVAGAEFYAEQLMMGRKVKYNGQVTESIPGEKITMRFSFPLSLVTDKIEMHIENHDAFTTFKHLSYMRFRFLSRTIFKNRNIKMLYDMDAHVLTEMQQMKNLLEKAQ